MASDDNNSIDSFDSKPTQTDSATPSQPKPSSAGDEAGLNPQPLPPKSTGGAVKDRKKMWIIVAIVAVILALIAGGLYYYSNSRKVLADALTKTITSDTGTFKGDIAFTTKSAATNVKVAVDIDSAQNKDIAQVDLKAKASIGALDFNLDASAIGTNSGESYVKLNNAKQLAEVAMGFAGNNKQMIKAYEPLIAKIDNKWIKIDQADDETTKCAQAMGQFSLSSADQKNLRKLFEKNEFIKAKNAGNGSFSEHHYSLTMDEKAAQKFLEETIKLESFKKVKADCDIESLAKSAKEEADSTTNKPPKVTAELWVNRWSHKPTKMLLGVEDDEAKLVFNGNLKLGEKRSISKPTDATRLEDITKEFQAQTLKNLGGTTTPAPSSQMSEAEIQQLLNSTMAQ